MVGAAVWKQVCCLLVHHHRCVCCYKHVPAKTSKCTYIRIVQKTKIENTVSHFFLKIFMIEKEFCSVFTNFVVTIIQKIWEIGFYYIL